MAFQPLLILSLNGESSWRHDLTSELRLLDLPATTRPHSNTVFFLSAFPLVRVTGARVLLSAF